MVSLHGTGIALITPFDKQGEVDYGALSALVRHVTQGGVDYLVVLGTTGEPPTLSLTEKDNILTHIKQENAGRLPLVLGIGGNCTADVLERFNTTDWKGIDALLSVTPYYNKPSQQGLYEHYKMLAAHTPVPMLLYNVPGRTGVNMSAETTLRIAHDCAHVIGTKEAAGSVAQVATILRDKPKDFLVISGDDALTLPFMSLGAHGLISVAGNAFPEAISKMVRLAAAQDYVQAAQIHLRMIDLFEAMFAEGNPVGVKAALHVLGIIENNLRLPMYPCTPALHARIEQLIKQFRQL